MKEQRCGLSPAKPLPCTGAQAKVAEILEDLLLQHSGTVSNAGDPHVPLKEDIQRLFKDRRAFPLPSTRRKRHLSSHPSCTFFVLLQHPLQTRPTTDVCPPCPTPHPGVHSIQDLQAKLGELPRLQHAAEHGMMGILVYSLAPAGKQV